MSQRKPKPDFQYSAPIFGWVFMALWLLMLAAFTYVFMRDQGFHQFDYPIEVGIMLLFWIFGIGGGSHVFSMPITKIWVADQTVDILERWPLRQALTHYSVGQIEPPRIKKHYDSDGDSYECLFQIPDGRTITIGTFNDREDAEKRLAEFQAKMGMGN